MLEVALRVILGGLLAGAAVAKLASPSSSRAAMATFGIAERRSQVLFWGALIVAELALAAGVIAGSRTAAFLAAALMATFAATMVGAIARGQAGAPCPCFGSRSSVGWGAVARNAAFAAAFAALPFLPRSELSTEQWLALGVGASLLVCGALAVAVLALAREVGMLRLRVGAGAALEIPDEGPALGTRAEVIDRFRDRASSELALAVFSSQGCPVCASLDPAVRSLANDPLIAVETFDEARDDDVWRELGIPGSPYALALDSSGTVLAKGTFNNLAQLESVIATAERRKRERGLVEVIGA